MSVVGLDVTFYVNENREYLGMRRMSAAFERAGAEVVNFKHHVFPRLITAFEAAGRQQFNEEGAGPATGHFAPLSLSYAKWKNEHHPGEKILELSGALREAMTNSNSFFAERSATDSALSFGSRNVEYASYHQSGTDVMPARSVFDPGADTEADIENAIKLGIRDAIKEAKLNEFVTEVP
jgi:phage gpG-like protein